MGPILLRQRRVVARLLLLRRHGHGSYNEHHRVHTRLGTGSMAAGFLGALTVLGGGVVIVPLLVLLFGVAIHYAIGASLVSVIATFLGAAGRWAVCGHYRNGAGAARLQHARWIVTGLDTGRAT